MGSFVQTFVCEAGFQGIVLSTMKLGRNNNMFVLMRLFREDECCGKAISWGVSGLQAFDVDAKQSYLPSVYRTSRS